MQGHYTTNQGKTEGKVFCYRPYPNEWRKPKASWLTVVLSVILAALIVFSAIVIAEADDTTSQAWILCEDYINIRLWASRKATSVGQLDPCDEIEIDGKCSNGFVHIVSPVDGWVHAGYVTFSKPEAIGATYSVCARKRVACRRWIDGPQVEARPWLKTGTEIQVFFMNDKWAVTSRGYVKSEWLEAAP